MRQTEITIRQNTPGVSAFFIECSVFFEKNLHFFLFTLDNSPFLLIINTVNCFLFLERGAFMTERKTEQAKSLLVRYIRDQQMKRGDRLPPQDFLRKTFKFGTATISAAINELKDDGVLEVRDKVGVFVIDPNADGHAGRTIGITMRHAENSLYYSCILTALQMRLVEEGCMIRLFRYQKETERKGIFFQIDDFPGLRRSLENQELQGLIHLDDFSMQSLKFIRSKKVPLVFVGSLGGIAPNGVVYDQARTMREIGIRLKRENPRRPALICQPSVLKCVQDHFQEAFGHDKKIYAGSSIPDAEKIADEILRMPDRERHDWIIYMDDILALAVTSRLAVSLPPEKLPRAVIMRNLQFQMRYPAKDPIFYDSNLSEFASIGVSLLMGAMKEGKLDAGKVYYHQTESK